MSPEPDPTDVTEEVLGDEPSCDERSVRRPVVDLFDAALTAGQFAFQFSGMASKQAEMVELEIAGGNRLLRLPERDAEGWEAFELRVPMSSELVLANSSIRTRLALLRCLTARAELEAELEALGARRSERRDDTWHLGCEGRGAKAFVRLSHSTANVVVLQRRNYDAVGAAMLAQLRGHHWAGGADRNAEAGESARDDV